MIPLQVLVVLLPSESSTEESFPTLGQSQLTWNVALAASSTDLWVGLHFARSPSGIHYHLNDALGADACLMRWCGSLCVCVSLSCGVERAESCNHSLTHLFWLEAVCAAADRMRAQGERCSKAHDKRVCRRSLSRAVRGGEREREGNGREKDKHSEDN